MHRATFKVALTAIAVAAACASTAHAAGFMLTEQSAGSLGRAYAGAGVDGTDLSGVYYNPATMVLHKGTAVQMGLVGVGLNLDYAGDDGTTANGRNKAEVIPHGYLVHQINDTVWFGLGITVPFGMGTEYDDQWQQADRGISANIITVDINPNFAFKLNEKFSIGFGTSIQYAQADLKKRSYPLHSMGIDAINNESEIDADSIAWGWNVGMMWSPVENFRVGLSYRSEIKHDAEGDLTVSDPRLSTGNGWGNSLDPNFSYNGLPVGALVNSMMGSYDGSATVIAPAWAMASVAWDINEVVSLYGTFRWTDWSSFDDLVIKGETVNLPTGGSIALGETIHNNWRDTYLGSLGMDLRLTDWWTLRGGIAYESSPISKPEYRTAIIPDADRWWFAIGSSFKWNENFQTDVSFAHLHGVHERNLYDSEQGGEKVGKFRKLDAYLLGVQMVYKF